MDYITSNSWLQLAFTLFVGNVTFGAAGYLLAGTGLVNDVTLLYVSFLLTCVFILSLFPLAVLSLSDTGSLKRVTILVKAIDKEELNVLHGRASSLDEPIMVNIESNPVMILREIAVAAVSDKDLIAVWTIIENVYERFAKELKANSSDDDVYTVVNAWITFCNPVKREVIRSEDEVSARHLFRFNIQLHYKLAELRLTNISELPLDDFLSDYIRQILKKDLFFELQRDMPKFLVQILGGHLKALNFSDQEMPTPSFKYGRIGHPDKVEGNLRLCNHWRYLTKELPRLLFDNYEVAADYRRTQFAELLAGNFHFMPESIVKSSNLTLHQKIDSIKELFYLSGKAVEYGIEKGITGDRMIFNGYIPGWFKLTPEIGYEAFFLYTRIIRKMHKNKLLQGNVVDDYFMILRECFIKKIAPEIITDLVDSVLSTTFYIVKSSETTKQTKKDFQYQTQWLEKEYLKPLGGELYESHKLDIENCLSDYEGWNEYFQGYIKTQK